MKTLIEELEKLKQWVAKQDIYTDPDVDLDSCDLSEKGGYKSAMWNVALRIEDIISRHSSMPEASEGLQTCKRIAQMGAVVFHAAGRALTEEENLMITDMALSPCEIQKSHYDLWNELERFVQCSYYGSAASYIQYIIKKYKQRRERGMVDSLNRIEKKKHNLSLPWKVLVSNNATPHIMTIEAETIDDPDNFICVMPAEIMHNYNSWDNAKHIVKIHNDMIHSHPMQDMPLAELANKAGWLGSVKISERPSGWRIVFSNGNIFTGKTYPAAEKTAREYLGKLEDK